MPRYFFNVIDGTSARAPDGTVLPDIAVAQAEAIRMAGEILRDLGGRFRNGTEWRLEVADEAGQVLFVIHVSAEERLPVLGSGAGGEAGPQSGPTTSPPGG